MALPSAQGHIMYSRPYPQHGFTISMRPFNADTDIPVFYEMAGIKDEGCTKPEILNSFHFISFTSTVKSYLIFCNRKPVCLIDFSPAFHSDISDYYPILPGDYFMSILPQAARLKGVVLGRCIQTCLEFLALLVPFGRILIELEADNGNDLPIRKAGFSLWGSIEKQETTFNIYCLSRKPRNRSFANSIALISRRYLTYADRIEQLIHAR